LKGKHGVSMPRSNKIKAKETDKGRQDPLGGRVQRQPMARKKKNQGEGDTGGERRVPPYMTFSALSLGSMGTVFSLGMAADAVLSFGKFASDSTFSLGNQGINGDVVFW